MENLVNSIQIVINELALVEEQYSSIPKMQSEIDSKLSDVLHYIENNKLNAVQCCRAVKLIQQLRKERRDINNTWELLRIYKNHELKLNNADNRQLLLAEIKKNEHKLSSSIYNNRVYTEIELNELIG